MKIQELILYTSRLKEQYQFYTETLQLPLVKASHDQFTVQVGRSQLTILKKRQTPAVHYAINIPSNMTQKALHWLKQRVKLLPYEGNDVIDFENWNADALYFYDADGNIVEFIARKNLHIHGAGDFSPAHLMNISEVALPSSDIHNVYDALNSIAKIPIFDGSFDRFCALGDEYGLFILIDTQKKKWFPTMEEAYPADLEVKGDHNFKFINGTVHKTEALV